MTPNWHDLQRENCMNLSDIRYRTKAAFANLPLAWHDARRNRQFVAAAERFLIVRHSGNKPHFYDVLLKWLQANHPSVRARFELRQLNCSIRDWKRYVLHVPWLQDPVQAWSPTAYVQANRLAAECDARGVPIINRVDRLSNAGKVEGAQRISSTGIRTAKMERITDHELFREICCGLEFPLFVREEWRHGGPIHRADSRTEAQRLPLWQFRRPVAVELVEVQDPRDGLFRKYRYAATGDRGFPVSMHPCRSWYAKGSHTEFNDSLRDEELAFLSQPDPNHLRLQAARRALGLDFVAFDYSYDRGGNLIVWEANPYPHIQFGSIHRQYRWPAVARLLAAMSCLYLSHAGLDVPAKLEEQLQFDSRAFAQQVA
jgi:hypothetical protein